MSEQHLVYPDNPIMAVAWASALRWALSTPECVAAFESDTGERMPRPARNGLEAMIDQATNVHEHYVESFIPWFNVNVWGEDPFAPAQPQPRP